LRLGAREERSNTRENASRHVMEKDQISSGACQTEGNLLPSREKNRRRRKSGDACFDRESDEGDPSAAEMNSQSISSKRAWRHGNLLGAWGRVAFADEAHMRKKKLKSPYARGVRFPKRDGGERVKEIACQKQAGREKPPDILS